MELMKKSVTQIFKYLETNECTSKQLISQRGNQKGNDKLFWIE